MVKSFFTLREMAIFTLRVWVWILPVLRQPSSVQPLSGLRGWTLSLCNSALLKPSFIGEGKHMYHFQRRPGVWQNPVQVALKWPNCIRKMLIPCGVVFPLLWTVVFWSQSPQDFNVSVAAVTCKGRHMMASDAFFLQWALHRQDLFYPARNYALFLGQARWSSLWTWFRTDSLYFRSA